MKHVLSSFNPQLIATNSNEITELIKDAEPWLPKYQLYAPLGVNLVNCENLANKAQILNEVWKVVTSWEDPVHYMNVADIFIEFPLKHLSVG